MAIATTSNSATVKWQKGQKFSNTSSTNSHTMSIDSSKYHTVKINNSGSCGHDPDTCGHRTVSGGSCSLDPSFDDDKCHWHTSERCYRPTDDGSPCELPGSQPDGACHIHSKGCNESLTHSGLEKAVFHSVKGAYRWLALHTDMRKGRFEIQPKRAARIAAEAGMAFLVSGGYDYDRERSLKDIDSKHLSKKGKLEKLINWFKSGFESPEGIDIEEDTITVEELKKAIKRAWNKINGGNHKAGARVAVAAGEAFLGEKLVVE